MKQPMSLLFRPWPMACLLAAAVLMHPIVPPARAAGDYGRDANPIVCAQLRVDLLEKAALMNEPRRNAGLYQAAERGCIEVAGALIAAGASVLARDRLGNKALHFAAKGGREGMIRLLVDRGAVIDQPNVAGTTPLLAAVEADKIKAVEALLAAGASVGRIGGGGVIALTAAAYNGNDRMVKLLLDKGALVAEADGTGKGPVQYAAAKGFASTATVLLDAGLDPNAVYGHGLTALHWAAGHGNDVPQPDGLSVVKLLIERGAAIDAADDRGRTPLMIAAQLSHPLVVGYLLGKGADPARKDRDGKRAADLIAGNDTDAVRKLLLK